MNATPPKEMQPPALENSAEERTVPDLSTRCPVCAVEMNPIHSHYQCPKCGWRDSCCF